jgi:phospholipid N-methyltransferase
MWSATRCVECEWLDVLQPDDPRAVRSRNDLRRINACMLQSIVMARSLIKTCGPNTPRTLLDLGSGDGTFMLRVARRLASHWQNVTVILLDRQNIVIAETLKQFRAFRWNAEPIVADVFDYLKQSTPSAVDVMTANLFLHHFPQQELAQLLALAAQRSRVLIACEPRRAALALLASRLSWAIGCSGVTRQDAEISVRAGFKGREISVAWPKEPGWDLREQPAMLFTHCFTAHRMHRTAH